MAAALRNRAVPAARGQGWSRQVWGGKAARAFVWINRAANLAAGPMIRLPACAVSRHETTSKPKVFHA
jgi:hypothetical protein